MRVRYYSTQRPVAPGTYPTTHRVLNITNFAERTYCPEIEREAWGYIDYMRALDEADAYDYELVRGYDQ